MNFEYETVVGVAAVVAAIAMMIGTGLGVLGAGIWIFKKALRYGKDKP